MNGRILDSSNNDPDLIYYDLVESYMSSTREILNGFMTFERGLIRILNNRIIFRHLAPAPVVPTPVVAAPAVAPAPASATTVAPTTLLTVCQICVKKLDFKIHSLFTNKYKCIYI